ERAPDRPRLSEFSSKNENSHGARIVDEVTPHDPLQLRRSQQLPWRRHHAVLAKLDGVRAVRPTLNGE
ncbi:MAG: hypothetical protein WCF43_08620, partial [Steroidobacteraceae bacterium]